MVHLPATVQCQSDVFVECDAQTRRHSNYHGQSPAEKGDKTLNFDQFELNLFLKSGLFSTKESKEEFMSGLRHLLNV